ncbi:MAG: hypothetical protein K0B07_04215 [DPANN group archaeon]|nr:hypothetical protein [DPANN group archaeon]
MSDKRLILGFTTYLMILVFMVCTVFAANLEADIGEYETGIYRDSAFIVPVSVTVDKAGTASVTLYPADGLSCDICVEQLVFDTPSTKEIFFTVTADNTGIYENPFDIEVSMADSVLVTATSPSIITVNIAPIMILEFSSDKYNVSYSDTTILTLSISVTGPIDGIFVYLDYHSDNWTMLSGNNTYDIGTITGEYDLSWILSADTPYPSNDFTITVTSTDPQEHITRTLSILKISEPDTSATDGGGNNEKANNNTTNTTDNDYNNKKKTDDNTSINNNTTIDNITMDYPNNTIMSATKKEATHRQVLVAGTGLNENIRLQTALETALGKDIMAQDIINDMMRISESITTQIDMNRQINVGSSQSNMQTSIKYKGKEKMTNFILYDVVPKSFALSAKDIKVTAPGARVEIVEDDPEFAIIFDTVSPGDILIIDYEVAAAVDADIVSSFTSEVYGINFEETDMCAQVMTTAINTETYECIIYPTPCDIPEGWDIIESCPVKSVVTNDSSEKEPVNNISKYMIIVSLLGIVGIIMVLHKNKPKKHSY